MVTVPLGWPVTTDSAVNAHTHTHTHTHTCQNLGGDKGGWIDMLITPIPPMNFPKTEEARKGHF